LASKRITTSESPADTVSELAPNPQQILQVASGPQTLVLLLGEARPQVGVHREIEVMPQAAGFLCQAGALPAELRPRRCS
jgi:hypothetical protein